MRALVDWFWSIFSGTGNTGAWSWFLSNWKIWLVVLLVGGLVVDWLTWVVRWRPYRLLTSRFRRAPVEGQVEEAWDDGSGYYAMEAEEDMEPGEWTEAPFATLSEIDPDWAGDVVFAEEAPYEDDAPYMPGAQTQQDAPYTHLYAAASSARAPYERTFGMGRMDAEEEPEAPGVEAWETPAYADEAADAPAAWDDEDEAAPEISWEEAPEEEPTYYEASSYDEAPERQPPEGFDPFAPYDAYEPQDVAEYEMDEPEEAPQAVSEDTGPTLYGRPGVWPGAQFPMPQQAQEEAPEPAPTEESPVQEAYDPLFNPDAPQPAEPRRRRRRLREHVAPEWQQEDPLPAEEPAPANEADAIPSWLSEPPPRQVRYQPPRMRPRSLTSDRTVPAYVNEMDQWADTRPSRVVRPEEIAAAQPEQPAKKRWFGRDKGDAFRTVTGKPANPRGLKRFASLQEDPIAGLPAMDLTDPFLPAARPDNVDFAPDEGEEYDP